MKADSVIKGILVTNRGIFPDASSLPGCCLSLYGSFRSHSEARSGGVPIPTQIEIALTPYPTFSGPCKDGPGPCVI